MNQEGKMEWLTLHELVVCNTYGCLVLFDWQVVWRLGCYLFTLVLLHWAPTWLGIKWEMPSYGSICLWHGHRTSCNFTIFLYNSTVLISWNIDLIWMFFFDWEYTGKTGMEKHFPVLKLSPVPSKPIFSDWTLANLLPVRVMLWSPLQSWKYTVDVLGITCWLPFPFFFVLATL